MSTQAYHIGMILGYNDFEVDFLEEKSNRSYLRGCIYENVQTALDAGFEKVYLFCLDVFKTLDYYQMYSHGGYEHQSKKIHKKKEKKEIENALRQQDDTIKDKYPLLWSEHRFRLHINRLLFEVSEYFGPKVECLRTLMRTAGLEKENAWDNYHFTEPAMLQITRQLCKLVPKHAKTKHFPRRRLKAPRLIIVSDSTLDRGHVRKKLNKVCPGQVRVFSVGGTTFCRSGRRFIDVISSLNTPESKNTLWHALGDESSPEFHKFMEEVYPTWDEHLALQARSAAYEQIEKNAKKRPRDRYSEDAEVFLEYFYLNRHQGSS